MSAKIPANDPAVRNGAERGAENLAKVRAAAARLLEAGPAERIAGQVNKHWFCREAAVDPQCIKRSRNPKSAEAFDAYDAADKDRWLTRLEARQLEADRKTAIREEDARKDDMIIILRAENARLRAELEQFRALRGLMAQTGRMP